MKARSVLLLLACVTFWAACREYMPTNRYLQKRARPDVTTSAMAARGLFDHARHFDTLAAHDLSCIDCHSFDMRIETSDKPLAARLSRVGQYSSGEACHYCHKEAATKVMEAPGTCLTCHDNLLALKPDDHDIAWLRVHANATRADPQSCANCHAQSYCINCHQRRDTIQTVVHDRNFRFTHSIVARANPMQCGSCHRQDYCTQCHQQGEIQ
jgi:hypothetical protein